MENFENMQSRMPSGEDYPYTVVASNPEVVAQHTPSVTTVAQLVDFARGQIVELPPFAENMPFVARMRRPSLLSLAKFGKIPNSLLTTAGQLFNGDGGALDADDSDMLGQMYDVCEIIAKASLIEPTFDQIHESGMELTDQQLLAIFNYTQGGVQALDSFR